MHRGNDAAVGRRDDIHHLQLSGHIVGALQHRRLYVEALARTVKLARFLIKIIGLGKLLPDGCGDGIGILRAKRHLKKVLGVSGPIPDGEEALKLRIAVPLKGFIIVIHLEAEIPSDDVLVLHRLLHAFEDDDRFKTLAVLPGSFRSRRDPLEQHIDPVLGLILVPGKGSVVMEGDGAGAVRIHLFRTFLAAVVHGDDGLVAALIRNGQRVGIQAAGDDPAGKLPGAAAPFDGDQCVLGAGALHQGVGPVALVLTDEVHDRILPAGVFLKHRDEFRALVQQYGDDRLGGEVLAVLCPFYEHAACLRRGGKGIGRRIAQIDLRGLIGPLGVKLRHGLALFITDHTKAFCAYRHNNAGRHIAHGGEMVRLSALYHEKETVFALFRNRDCDVILTAGRRESTVQGASFLRKGTAPGVLDPVLAQHAADIPARLVNILHPGNGEHILILILEIALAGPLERRLLCFRRGCSLLLSTVFRLFCTAGCDRKQHDCAQDKANNFLHCSIFLLLLLT